MKFKIIKKLLRLFGRQQYLRFGVRDRIIRFFHNPDTALSEEFIVSFWGNKYRGNFDTFLDWSVFYFGAYAREELRLMKQILEVIDEPTVFDVGANIGHHTLFLARYSKKIYCFEPFDSVSKKLKEKIIDNNLTNVELCSFGLGEKNSIDNYYPPNSCNTGTGSFLSDDLMAQSVKLEIRNGDDFIKERSIGKVDFIKMDIEGFEPFALSGLCQTLRSHRPICFFEWTENKRKTQNLQNSETLFPENYSFYQFIDDIPIYIFFRQLTFKLEQITHWADGNILAVPTEYVERLNLN